MKNPQLAFDIVKEIKSVIKKPLSIKMRLGFDNNSKNYLEFAQKMEDAGADMITVHGRTRSQMYSGEVDYNAIKEIKNTVSIPIIANGDITSLEKAIQVLEITNADGIMIGRGAIGQPELIYRIEHFLKTGEILPELSLKERINILISHLNLELKYYREPINALKFMRKFYAYYIKEVRGASQYREKLVKAESFDEIFSILEEISTANN
jgi:tRNA-dihydrouridine synthase B